MVEYRKLLLAVLRYVHNNHICFLDSDQNEKIKWPENSLLVVIVGPVSR